ncbi:MAG: 5-formyltetrahydrofolate cyclo-ligase [Hyphomicrobiaceae bacterium]
MPETDAIVAAKVRMRDEAKARRAALSPEARAAAATAIASHGLTFLGGTPADVVSAFLPIGEEVSPIPLVARLRREGSRISLPVMIAKGKPLVFRLWEPGAPLRSRMWGIREPEDTAPVAQPDVLLVPLLAFDRAGRRLGYGGGFYDRTIAALRATGAIATVGLAFAAQEVDAVPALDYDEHLDWVLTEDGPICTMG